MAAEVGLNPNNTCEFKPYVIPSLYTCKFCQARVSRVENIMHRSRLATGFHRIGIILAIPPAIFSSFMLVVTPFSASSGNGFLAGAALFLALLLYGTSWGVGWAVRGFMGDVPLVPAPANAQTLRGWVRLGRRLYRGMRELIREIGGKVVGRIFWVAGFVLASIGATAFKHWLAKTFPGNTGLDILWAGIILFFLACLVTHQISVRLAARADRRAQPKQQAGTVPVPGLRGLTPNQACELAAALLEQHTRLTRPSAPEPDPGASRPARSP